MKHFFLFMLILLAFSFSAFSQNNLTGLKTVEFISPISKDGKLNRIFPAKNCFSFITESADCRKVSDIYYNTFRSDNQWDWFQAMGKGSRNNIKSLGKKKWTDSFKVPFAEPYPKMNAGEERLIVIGDGSDSRLPNFIGVDSQSSEIFPNNLADVRSSSRLKKKSQPKSNYKPFKETVKGNMYVMRVVDDKNDFYVLFRVDELERGQRCKISWKRIESPKRK